MFGLWSRCHNAHTLWPTAQNNETNKTNTHTHYIHLVSVKVNAVHFSLSVTESHGTTQQIEIILIPIIGKTKHVSPCGAQSIIFRCAVMLMMLLLLLLLLLLHVSWCIDNGFCISSIPFSISLFGCIQLTLYYVSVRMCWADVLCARELLAVVVSFKSFQLIKNIVNISLSLSLRILLPFLSKIYAFALSHFRYLFSSVSQSTFFNSRDEILLFVSNLMRYIPFSLNLFVFSINSNFP